MTAKFSPDDVMAATGAVRQQLGEAAGFNGISTDTRTLAAGALFVALSGENFDGHHFVAAALARGAAGLVVSRSLPENSPSIHVFLVSDTREALQALARYHRRRFAVPVIAVTGSNGKTSTKDMIAAALGPAMRVLKTEANFNNEIGLSQTLLHLEDGHQAVVVEMGMRAAGEIAGLAAVALPTLGVVTNVGETHIERLGSIENIAAAKSELVEAIGPGGAVVLNGDDAHVRNMRSKTQAKVVLYGLRPDNDVRAVQLEHRADGVKFRCEAGKLAFAVELPVPGQHNVYNALAAIAAGLQLGVAAETLAAGLAGYAPGKMRLDIQQYGEMTVINDAYNASPLSMAAAIGVLASVAPGRKVAAIGDMLELGDTGPSAHRRVGDQLAAAGVAAVVTLGELAALTGETVRKQGIQAVSCLDHAAAATALKKILQPGDTLLLKGSRGMAMEKLLTVFSSPTEG